MKVSAVTLFPEMFAAVGDFGVSGRAIKQGLLDFNTVNPRDFASDKHRTVDDKAYGGGPGMVMAVEPLSQAIREAKEGLKEGLEVPAKVVYLSPQGTRLNQRVVEQLAVEPALVLLCGRYEGIDERVIESEVDEEISLGDYVISGGELAAMVVLDAIIRQLPGALGSDESAGQDSFAGLGLFDHPHYTRPEEINGRCVPDVLLSGNHSKIADWRFEQALLRTMQRRPEIVQELLEESRLSEKQLAILKRLLNADT